MSWILSASEDIWHMKLPLWLPMLWLEVVLITITLCSGVSQLCICANFNGFRTILPELWPTPPSIHTSLQLEKHYISCRLSTVLSLILPCLFISFYTVVIPNTLNPFSYPDIVHIALVEVNLMACFLRFPTLLQFSSLKSILDSVLPLTHLWFGMTFWRGPLCKLNCFLQVKAEVMPL